MNTGSSNIDAAISFGIYKGHLFRAKRERLTCVRRRPPESQGQNLVNLCRVPKTLPRQGQGQNLADLFLERFQFLQHFHSQGRQTLTRPSRWGPSSASTRAPRARPNSRCSRALSRFLAAHPSSSLSLSSLEFSDTQVYEP